LVPGDTPEICGAIAKAAGLLAANKRIQPPLLILERQWRLRQKIKSHNRHLPDGTIPQNPDTVKASTTLLAIPNANPNPNALSREEEEALISVHVKPVSFSKDVELYAMNTGAANSGWAIDPAIFFTRVESELEFPSSGAKNGEVENSTPKPNSSRLDNKSLDSTLLGSQILVHGETPFRTDLHTLLHEYSIASPWPTLGPDNIDSVVQQSFRQQGDKPSTTVPEPSPHDQDRIVLPEDAVQHRRPGYREHSAALLDRLNFGLPQLPQDETNNIYTLISQSRGVNVYNPDSRPETPTISVSELHEYKRRIQELRRENKHYQIQIECLDRENRLLKDLRFGSDGMSRVDL
jgi:hypothetical protein